MFTRIALLSSVLLVAGGCAGAEYGAELRKRPEPLALDRPENRSLRLPGDTPFTITLKEATEKAELTGTADADATADGDGSGMARAEVSQGGTASSGFQVGHALRNQTSRHMQVEVAARMKLTFEVGDADEDPLPLAGAFATLYARDNQNRTLARHTLLAHQSDVGDASGTEDKTVSFDLLLGPGETANIYVAGNVQINAEEGKSAAGSVTLEGLEMKIQVQPAPGIEATGDAGA